MSRSWIREVISDDAGQADAAYVSILALMISAIGSLVFIFAMSALAYAGCEPVASVATTPVGTGGTTVAVHRCAFDPLPVGQACGLIFGAFAALIGSLAGYMAATKRSGRNTTTTAEASVSTTTSGGR